jgi:tripartite-type tricarboxylate transporter receptor subunit TctC
MLRRLFAATAVAALIAWSASAVMAQTYPTKPIKIIVPVPAGALTDIVARRIGAEMSTRMGQTWIMENRPGANFMPAAEACRHAASDGYTLCVFTTSTLTFNPHLITNIPYDVERDFRPIINLGMLIGGLVASPKLDVSNMAELKAMALAQPGKLNFGTYGPASSANVFRQYMTDQWKANIVEVAYKGSNELVAALISGEIQMTWTAVGNWADNPNNSKGKILTIDATKRMPLIPNVPIYPEVGFGEYPIHTWVGLFAPGQVPDAIINRVNADAQKVLSDPQMVKFLNDQLIEPMVTSAPDFAAYVAKERAETGKLFARFNIPKIQ